ncbi:MAG TPA: restriction endonuclease subunit S [Candidatus Anaerobiospirillum pullistercoris]|uniref:Restriction endonuclease subunit S n=1 Tax=Candidatus Anaerobiospirillum pullistercoris TaxID=2838452 RepID=A0A9D1WDP1_9GAMM|nr:restriction endonuclease subunit S [Candidatus Anaerobiospirillum pullistercoris]
MTKQKHTKAVDAASNAEELLPLEQMMSQGSASNEGAAHAVDDINQVNDSAHQGAEDESAALVSKLRFADFALNSQQSYEPLARVLRQSFSGGTPASNIDAYWNGDIHWASTKDLTSNVLTTTADFITELGLRNSSSKLAKAGSILVGMHIGVGKVAIANIDVAINQDLRALVPDLSRVDLWFLLYVLEANAIRLESYGRGSTVKGITQEDLLQLPVPLLPLPEQQRIGALFKELDNNIELNRGLLEKLIQLKKSMLEQMFPREGESVPRLRFAGFTEPWTVCKLGDLGQAISGIAFPESAQGGVEGMPFFKVSDMNLEGNESVMHYANNYVSYELVAKSKWKPIEGPAAIFVRDGAAVLLNRKRLILSKCLMDHHIMHYCLDESVWNPFFALAIFEGIDLTALVRTSVTPSYGAVEVEAIVVKVPNLAEQQRIGAFFKALDQRIAQQRAKLEKLGQLKKALLEQMFV